MGMAENDRRDPKQGAAILGRGHGDPSVTNRKIVQLIVFVLIIFPRGCRSVVWRNSFYRRNEKLAKKINRFGDQNPIRSNLHPDRSSARSWFCGVGFLPALAEVAFP
jgi:hypothetical protein